jgi:hypothetical protein
MYLLHQILSDLIQYGMFSLIKTVSLTKGQNLGFLHLNLETNSKLCTHNVYVLINLKMIIYLTHLLHEHFV